MDEVFGEENFVSKFKKKKPWGKVQQLERLFGKDRPDCFANPTKLQTEGLY